MWPACVYLSVKFSVWLGFTVWKVFRIQYQIQLAHPINEKQKNTFYFLATTAMSLFGKHTHTNTEMWTNIATQLCIRILICIFLSTTWTWPSLKLKLLTTLCRFDIMAPLFAFFCFHVTVWRPTNLDQNIKNQIIVSTFGFKCPSTD